MDVDVLAVEVAPALRRGPAAAWLKAWEAGGVARGRISTVAEALHNPQVPVRNMALEIAAPTSASLFVAANPVKLSDVSEPARHRAQ